VPVGAPAASLAGRAQGRTVLIFLAFLKKDWNKLKNVDENMLRKPTFLKML
jgi:hypothetical protein